ncbi:hypothetical protein MuYL_4878 [Mucilaginibacter xinganensis]|uniref:Uncharacterized protein n=1 Tax=Mucilaginibacter xinganensis TaxID=1234841 RepID=A0A223P4N7_9SPHI|nr:hypothetical protein MuYL_4878 [Mucilaginibacter xinganensis]
MLHRLSSSVINPARFLAAKPVFTNKVSEILKAFYAVRYNCISICE